MSSSSSSNPEVKETAILTWNASGRKINSYDSSPYFNAQNSENKFQLSLFANQQFDKNHVFTRLYYNNNQTELPFQYQVSILDANGRKQYTREYTWNYSKSDYTYSNYNVTNFISLYQCKELLVDANLKIYCEVDVFKSKPQLPGNLLVKEIATLTWCVNGFSSLNYQVNSPMFFEPTSTDKFSLNLIPDNKTNFCLNHVIIRLHYIGNRTELPLQYRVSIIDSNGQKKYTREFTWNYFKSDNTTSNENVTNYIHNDKCKELLVNGSLKIYCEVDVLENKPLLQIKPKEVKDTSTQNMAICKYSNSSCQTDPTKLPQVNVLENKESESLVETNETAENTKTLQHLLEQSEFSDFSFVVSGKKFRVHKAILAARSKVFRAMFITDLERNKQNQAELNDIDVEVFEVLVRYLYTNQIPDMNKYASKLFIVADKYQLDQLKSICEQSLGSSLTTESVTAVLQLADFYQAENLRSKCTDFITANSAAVIATDGWKQLRKNRIELVAEMLENMIISSKK